MKDFGVIAVVGVGVLLHFFFCGCRVFAIKRSHGQGCLFAVQLQGLGCETLGFGMSSL